MLYYVRLPKALDQWLMSERFECLLLWRGIISQPCPRFAEKSRDITISLGLPVGKSPGIGHRLNLRTEDLLGNYKALWDSGMSFTQSCGCSWLC